MLLVSIPFVFALDLFYSGFSVDILTTINTSLSILFLEVLIIYYIVKKIQPESKYLTNLLRVEVVIAILLTGTMIFYYPFLFISGLFLGLLIPLILSSCFFYLPLAFSRKKKLFNVEAIDFLILLNTLFLGACIVVIPTMISFEILKLGLKVSFLYPIIATLVILFLFGKIIISLANKITISTLLRSFLHITLILNWILLSAFVAYTIFDEFSALISISSDLINWNLFLIPFSIFLFFSLHTYNIILLQNLRDYFKDITQQDTLSLKVDKILTYCKYGVFYGIVGSLSLIFTFATVYFDILVFLPKDLMILNYILFIILFWSLFNPIFFKIFPNFDSPNVLRKNINRISLSLAFSISFMVFTQLFWSIYLHAMVTLTYSIPFFLFSLFLIGLFGYQKSKMMEEENELIKQFYLVFMELIILFLSILWLEPILMIPFLIILNILLSFKRPRKLSIRWVQYSILSTLGFIRFIIWFEQLNILSLIMGLHYGINIILYLMNLILVLAFSILLNLHHKNFNEKVSLYLAFSALTFTFLMSFTTILLIYGITISLFIFLVSFGIDLYIAGDNNYKLFIKPCIVIFVFNMISWISYTFLFTKPAIMFYNIILTFSLTATVTSLTFIILYKDLVDPFRKIFIGFSCLSITIFIPTFIYVLFISYLQINFTNPILIIISLNLAFALFYVSISIYYWEISWKIWRVGWYLWLIIPIANFYLINKLILGVDVYTNAISFLGMFDLTGSFIITLILSTLFYIPVFYSKLKKYFYEIIIIIWAESLSLTYWISQNLFSNSLILSNLFFGLLSVLIIIPILWKMKMWWIISLLWFLLAALNCGFLTYFLYSLNFLIELIISIDIIIVSIFSLLFSMFPNIRGRKSRILLIFSYFLTLLGVFLLIFFILFNILMQPIISMNLAFIIISGALFTSKYIKLNQIYTRFAISLVFIVNISSIVFFTFNMIPNLVFFSFFFALATFFGSLLLVNHFDMIIRRVNYKFFWIPFGFSLSLSFVLFLFLFIPSHIYFLSGLFILINVLFIHRILNRFISVIIFLYPIAIVLFLLEVIILIEFLRNYLILIALFLYVSIYQTLFNILRYCIKMGGINVNPFYKILFKDPRRVFLINIGCFSFNSLIFSFLLSLISFSVILYQLIFFSITLSILLVLNLYYIRINNKYLDIKSTALMLNVGGVIFYTIIPIFSAISSVLILFSNTFNFTNMTITFLFTLSSVLFLEILVDKFVFNLLLLKKDSAYSHTKLLHSLGYLIYIQCDIISFLLIINFIGIFESLIVFMGVLIPLLLGDIYVLALLAKKVSYLALTILSLCYAILGFLILINYSYPQILLIKLDTMLFIGSLFITNYLYFKSREIVFTEKALESQNIKEMEGSHNKFYSIRKNILGISFYLSFIIFIQDVVSILIPIDELIPHIFLISSFIFILSGVDKKILRFLEGASKYFLSVSWILLIITSNVFLIDLWGSFIPEFLITVVPTIIFVSSLQLIYLCKILSFWTVIESNETRIQNILISFIFIDVISLPLYFLTIKFIFIDFNLIFLSIILSGILLKLDDLFKFTYVNKNIESKLLYYTGFIIINMISIDLFILFEFLIRPFLPLFSFTLNLNLSLLVLFVLYAQFFKIFDHHSRITLISWILIFITFSSLIFQITFYFDFLPVFFTLTLFSISLLLYPFIFLMEKMRQLFQLIINKVLGFFITIYHKFASFFTFLKQYFLSLKNFIKKYWVYQLVVFCGILGIILTLVLTFSLNFAWFNSILIGWGIALFIIFFAYSYKKSMENPNVALKYRMLYLSSIWSAILGIVFNFLFVRFYLIAFFLSLVILGAILLPYIYYKEKKEGISIKWRFYFTLMFILIVILTLILFYFQIIIEIF